MRRTTPLGLVLLFFYGCLQSSTGLSGDGEARIQLRVTGGIAGVDYTFLVDGPGGVVRGVACVAGCDFTEGEVLQPLSRSQSAYLSQLFRDAGIHTLSGTDFGTECCDQFYYELAYEDGTGTSSVEGSSELLPADLRDAVAQVQALAQGVIPVLLDPDTHPEQWDSDWLIGREVELEGDRLNMTVQYSGGCAVHEFQLVAWGGWLESYPVQVRAFLFHDDHDDPCDAVVTRDIAFDLRPLRQAYEQSYGVGAPGSTTLIVVLANPDPSSSLSDLHLEYVF